MITNSLYFYPFMKSLNITDHERFIVEEIKSFSKVEWFRKHKGSFGKFSNAPFAEILTIRGAAFSFNLLDFDEMLNEET